MHCLDEDSYLSLPTSSASAVPTELPRPFLPYKCQLLPILWPLSAIDSSGSDKHTNQCFCPGEVQQ